MSPPADAWGRLTGEAGVALVTGGPGHANAVGALFTALGAESPMLLLALSCGKPACVNVMIDSIAAPVIRR